MAHYQIRPSNESISALEVFKAGLLMGKKHVLFFEKYSGEVEYSRERPEESSVRIVVEARSARCRDDWLKPADRKKVLAATVDGMLAADRYPDIAFSSTRIVPKGSSRLEVQGTFSISGTTRPATMDVTITPIGDDRLELDCNSVISLRDYGLKPPSSALGLIRTKDNAIFRFLLWAEKAV